MAQARPVVKGAYQLLRHSLDTEPVCEILMGCLMAAAAAAATPAAAATLAAAVSAGWREPDTGSPVRSHSPHCVKQAV